jgi:hypothetical protein
LVSGPLAIADRQGPALPDLNRKVLKFAEDNQGKQVGNGECWTLAVEALAYAGARPPGAKGVGVYDFGRKLDDGEKILPGDVMQFEKAKFVHKTATGSSWVALPHHTGVVAKVEGMKISLLHQNYKGKRTVQLTTINVDERTEGTVQFFRPIPKK